MITLFSSIPVQYNIVIGSKKDQRRKKAHRKRQDRSERLFWRKWESSEKEEKERRGKERKWSFWMVWEVTESISCSEPIVLSRTEDQGGSETEVDDGQERMAQSEGKNWKLMVRMRVKTLSSSPNPSRIHFYPKNRMNAQLHVWERRRGRKRGNWADEQNSSWTAPRSVRGRKIVDWVAGCVMV